MKLPSIQQVQHEAKHTISRFPFVIFSALVGTISLLILIEHQGEEGPTILFPIILAAALGIPLLLSLKLFAERRKWSVANTLILQAVGVILAAIYGSTNPTDLFQEPAIYLVRFQLYLMALVLLVTSIPFSGFGTQIGFWQYCKALFFRVLATGLFAFVLFTGLAVALAALDNLFGLNVPPKRYLELWVLIVGVFGILFFLTGVPNDLEELDSRTDYPKGMKIFAQYILSPLVFIYFVILYAYIGKIVGTWNWPQGWVSRLILGFSAVGISALVILFPIREIGENRWVKSASRWFWYSLIPLQVVLFLAIWRRVGDYGITELRYCGIALALWLTLMALYFIVSKSKNIKVLPASFCLFSLLISFGPWGIFGVSETNQVNRLHNLLTKNSILVSEKVQKSQHEVGTDDTRQISSILWYLHMMHGYDRIQPWFDKSLLKDSTGNWRAYKDPDDVAKILGINYSRVSQHWEGSEFTLRRNKEQSLNVLGFDRMLSIPYISASFAKQSFPGEELTYRLNSSFDTMTFVTMSDGKAVDSTQILLTPLVDSLYAEFGNAGTEQIPSEKMSITAQKESMKTKVCLDQITLKLENSKPVAVALSGYVFYCIVKQE